MIIVSWEHVRKTLVEDALSRFFRVTELSASCSYFIEPSAFDESDESDGGDEACTVVNLTEEQKERVSKKAMAFWEQFPKRRALTYEDVSIYV